MIILTEAPPPDSDLSGLYARLPIEGMLHSSRMCGESYRPSSLYDDAWSCPAVTWSAGGHETYQFANGDIFELQNSGAMTIAAGDRYSYRAGDTPFRSNMIVFPRWLTTATEFLGVTLRTRLIRSDRRTEALLQSFSERCRTQSENDCWYREKLVSLYRRLTVTQKEIDSAAQRVAAEKTSTQEELVVRIDRAQQYILRNFHDPELSVACIARAACLSPYHLIRTFRAVTGRAPIQYLQATRLTAALRLLQETELSVSGIARGVGYSDRTAFARSFRRLYGTTPSTVRKSATSPDRCTSAVPE